MTWVEAGRRRLSGGFIAAVLLVVVCITLADHSELTRRVALAVVFLGVPLLCGLVFRDQWKRPRFWFFATVAVLLQAAVFRVLPWPGAFWFGDVALADFIVVYAILWAGAQPSGRGAKPIGQGKEV